MKKQSVELNNLRKRILKCKRCPKLCQSRRQVVPGYGPVNAKLMMIGLAPGREGADMTGIPFTRDPTGLLLEEMTRSIGISLDWDTYRTNIVKCNPKDSKKRNRNPTKKEIENCYSYLVKELELVNPEILVPLGRMATEIVLKKKVRRMSVYHSHSFEIDGRIVLPLYHPGYVVRGAYKKEKYKNDFKKLERVFVRINQTKSLKDQFNRIDLLLLLLYAPGATDRINEPIQNKTRLQKEIFLAQKKLREMGIKGLYSFRPYLFGPFGRDIYIDIEWLEKEGVLREDHSFLGDDGISCIFKLTSNGVSRVISMLENPSVSPIFEIVKMVKKEFNQMKLSELVAYTHRIFPEYLKKELVEE